MVEALSFVHNKGVSFMIWDPDPRAFIIPYFNHPVMWYGICFVFGFLAGYFLLVPMFAKRLNIPRGEAAHLADRLLWYVVAGTLIGARLGHVFFYDWPRYQQNPMDILKVWEGGLASHGGTVGVMLALYLFLRSIKKQFPSFTFISLIDQVVVPTAFVAFCIRIGNFINQEILGTETNLPWGIIFGHPADGSAPAPRHPVQLYEAAVYLFTFGLLYWIWKRYGNSLKEGVLSGLFFILVFGSRIVLESFKAPQSLLIDESYISMGQYLSIPFVLLGFWLLFRSKKTVNSCRSR